MSYQDSGTLTTDKRTVDESTEWDTTSDWEEFDSRDSIDIEDGSLILSEAIPDRDNIRSRYIASSFDDSYSNNEDIDDDWIDSEGDNDASVQSAPVYRDSVANGEPAVEFDGTNDSFDTGFIANTDEFRSVYAVVLSRDTTDNRTLYGANGNDSRTYLGQRETDQWSAAYGDTLHEGGTITEDDFILISHVAGSGDVETWENGESEASGSYSESGTTGVNDHIGCLRNDTERVEFWDGYIAEIVIYDTEHDNSTRESIESYLNDKYDLY